MVRLRVETLRGGIEILIFDLFSLQYIRLLELIQNGRYTTFVGISESMKDDQNPKVYAKNRKKCKMAEIMFS